MNNPVKLSDILNKYIDTIPEGYELCVTVNSSLGEFDDNKVYCIQTKRGPVKLVKIEGQKEKIDFHIYEKDSEDNEHGN